MMKISKSHTRLDPFVSREPDAEEATKANPYQPPWVRKIQEGIALVLALLLVVGLHYLFMGIGGKIPGAVRDASIYLDGVQRSAEGRLNDAAQEPHERQAQFQNPASSSATLVHARALSGAPGAIVCSDYQAVTLVFSLYNRSFEDRLQDTMTKGLSRSLRGPSIEEPDPLLFGCVVVPDGMPMMKEPGSVVPVVTVRLKDRSFFKGVTMLQMIMGEGDIGQGNKWGRNR